MELFIRAVALILLSLVIILLLRSGSPHFGQLITVLICCMVAITALGFVSPILDFIRSMQAMSGIDSDVLTILWKIIGISVIAEVTSLLCQDSGNSAMGKTMEMLATAVILCLSLPLLTALMELMEGILKKV